MGERQIPDDPDLKVVGSSLGNSNKVKILQTFANVYIIRSVLSSKVCLPGGWLVGCLVDAFPAA